MTTPPRPSGGAGWRVERDTMGEVRLPADARWGPQTQRAVENFPVSGDPIDAALILALGEVKAAAALANRDLGVLDDEVARAIHHAARDVAEGRWNEQFPVDVFQTGSGTSSNMNANEVIASLAAEQLGRPVHPNDEVNASQSSNDVFPTAIRVAATITVHRELLPALSHLAGTLRRRSAETAEVVKAGRTHLMDAVPVTLGQELGGYATQVERGIDRLGACLPRLAELPIGGTAVGTGLNAPHGFGRAVATRLAAALGLPFVEAADHFEAQGAQDALVETSGMLRVVAISLHKIANDVRLLASGPTAGLAELRLPPLQPGSSIMPGKVNPVIPEAVLQVVAQVVGNDAAVAWAGAQGVLELNTMLPVMARNLLESVRLLTAAARLLADRAIAGLEVDEVRARRYALGSPALATALNPHLGYEEAARVVRRAIAEGRTVRDVVVDEGLLADDEVDLVLDVLAMTRGGLNVGGDGPPAPGETVGPLGPGGP